MTDEEYRPAEPSLSDVRVGPSNRPDDGDYSTRLERASGKIL
jgi:hypothetical protein